MPEGRFTMAGDGEANGGRLSLSIPCALGLILLSVATSVGVGIIVFFSTNRDATLCSCTSQSEVPNPSPFTFSLKRRCTEFVKHEDPSLCSVCYYSTTHKPSSSAFPYFTTSVKNASPATTQPTLNKSLPGVISPYHYNLDLFVDIYQPTPSLFRLYGNVSIFLDVYKSTNVVTFHAKKLNISNLSLVPVPKETNQSELTIVKTLVEKEREMFSVYVDQELTSGKRYRLDLQYHVRISSSPFGVHYSSDRDGTGSRQIVASSLFQPTRARWSVPCFDEPQYKSTFNVTLVRQSENYTTYSNTNILRQVSRDEDHVADIFATTPKMSIYILALAVVNYVHIENVTSGGVLVRALALSSIDNIKYRTVTKPSALKLAWDSHYNGLKLFNWYEDNLQPAYPMSKIDNIIIRGGFGAAMENWGLVTYKENLLFDPALNSMGIKLGAVLLMAHEFAHQWFGNLVTPRTWRWLWLSEGFATYFEYDSVNNVFPSWRVSEYFVVAKMHRLFQVDTDKQAPLVKDEPMFDFVLYNKGSCVVRMLELILGTEVFKSAINDYLTTYRFGSVTSSDLWKVLNKAAMTRNLSMEVGELMEPWLTQRYFPLVTATRVHPGILEIRQQVFQTNTSPEDDGMEAKSGYKWNIPITFITVEQPLLPEQEVTWIHRNQDRGKTNYVTVFLSDKRIPAPSDTSKWVLLNPYQKGYYRVNYDVTSWQALIQQLHTDYTVIPAVNRAQLIDDAFALARAGVLDHSVAYRMLNFLRNDTDYVPWTPASAILDELSWKLDRSPLYGAFQAYMTDLVHLAYRGYGLREKDTDTPLDTFQRTRIANLACKFGIPECLQDASHLFNRWATNATNRPPPDLLVVTSCYGVQEGGLDAWNFLQRFYKSTSDYRTAQELVPSLSCLKDRVLSLALEKDVIRAFHQSLLLKALLKSSNSREVTWDFIKNNAERLRTSVVTELLFTAADVISSDTFILEAEFTARKKPKISPRTLTDIISRFRKRRDWLSDRSRDLTDWLRNSGYGEYII